LRFKKIQMTQEFIKAMLERAMQGRFPKDVVVTGARVAPMTGMIQLMLYSAEFDDLPEGALPYVEDTSLQDLMEFEPIGGQGA